MPVASLLPPSPPWGLKGKTACVGRGQARVRRSMAWMLGVVLLRQVEPGPKVGQVPCLPARCLEPQFPR